MEINDLVFSEFHRKNGMGSSDLYTGPGPGPGTGTKTGFEKIPRQLLACLP